MVDTWSTCPRCGQQCYGQMSTGGFEPTPTHRCQATITTSELDALKKFCDRAVQQQLPPSEQIELAARTEMLIAHAERLEAQNKRLWEAFLARIDKEAERE
jgi:hypothetical protein